MLRVMIYLDGLKRINIIGNLMNMNLINQEVSLKLSSIKIIKSLAFMGNSLIFKLKNQIK